MEYDVIIVGGSFSGLSSAYFLAQKGLKVCLFEGRKIGESTKSTGILMKSVIKDLDVPDSLIEANIYGLNIYSPKMVEYEYRFNKLLFYPSDTLNFLKWLKKLAIDSNVKIIENKFCKDIKINSNGVNCEDVFGKMIIIASCFIPDKIQSLIPKENVIYYTGLEYIVDGIRTKNKDMWQMYFDYNIAPGYFSWIASTNTNLSHVGLVRKINNISIQKSMSLFLSKTGVKLGKIKEVRAGVVPLSGPRKKTYGNRFILVGDAAGQIDALFSAGINYAARVGKIVGKIIPNIIDEPNESNLKLYEDSWKGEFGELLQKAVLYKKLYDRLNSNEKWESFLQFLDSVPRKDVIKIFDRFTNFKPLNLTQIFLPYFLKHPWKIGKLLALNL